MPDEMHLGGARPYTIWDLQDDFCWRNFLKSQEEKQAMPDFDMPETGTWEELGGWVVNALARDLDLPIENAAGFVGNPAAETSGFTDLQEDRPLTSGSRGGRGWAQWTGTRRRQFETWCASHSLNPDSNEANYRFLVVELKMPGWQSFLTRLRNAPSLEEACRLTLTLYERPLDQGQSALNRRIWWGKRALMGAKAEPVLQPTPMPEPEPKIIPADLITFEMVEPAVKNLQSWLRFSGDYYGEIDGIAGEGTIDAITSFTKRTRK